MLRYSLCLGLGQEWFHHPSSYHVIEHTGRLKKSWSSGLCCGTYRNMLRATLYLVYWFRGGVVPPVVAPRDRAFGTSEEELVLRSLLWHLQQYATCYVLRYSFFIGLGQEWFHPSSHHVIEHTGRLKKSWYSGLCCGTYRKPRFTCCRRRAGKPGPR